MSGQVDEAGREDGMSLARELITWRLTEGEDEGPKYVAREAAQLIDQPMLMVGVVMALTEALAVTFGTVEEWRAHIVAADLGESIDGGADDYWQARIDRANQMHDSLERQRDEAVARAVAAEGQVAAIRALPQRMLAQAPHILTDEAQAIWTGGYNQCLIDVEAALVASSPTTPEAKK